MFSFIKRKKNLKPVMFQIENHAKQFEVLNEKYLNMQKTNGTSNSFNVNLKIEMHPDFGGVLGGTLNTFVSGIMVEAEGYFDIHHIDDTALYLPSADAYARYYIVSRNDDGSLKNILVMVSGRFSKNTIIDNVSPEAKDYKSFDEMPFEIKNILNMHKGILRRAKGEYVCRSRCQNESINDADGFQNS